MNQKGVSLIELVLVASTIIFLSLLISNLPSSVASINRSRHTSIARDIASKQIEYLRKQGYENLPAGANYFTDSSLPSLSNATASYTIDNCPVNICQQEEAVKKATVVVAWTESGEEKKVELVTLIGQGGLGQ